MEEAATDSPLTAALASVGDRWSLLLVAALLDGPRRFGDLREEMSGVAPNVLSARLRHLEGQGVLLARPYSQRPPRSVYELTETGRDLAGALRLLTEWGSRRTGDPEAPAHEACGTPLESRWFCPTCDRVVEEDESDEGHIV